MLSQTDADPGIADAEAQLFMLTDVNYCGSMLEKTVFTQWEAILGGTPAGPCADFPASRGIRESETASLGKRLLQYYHNISAGVGPQDSGLAQSK